MDGNDHQDTELEPTIQLRDSRRIHHSSHSHHYFLLYERAIPLDPQ